MTENSKHIIKIELPDIVNDTLRPLAVSIGDTLSYTWTGVFGGIETWSQKKSIERNHNLSKFQESIEENVSRINPNNLQEPKMYVMGPAIESSKYFFEEEQYREMFAKLIASSCDKSKNHLIHPSFVEIIKQITPLDARIISSLPHAGFHPIVDFIMVSNDGSGFHTVEANLYFMQGHEYSLKDCACAITNLERLGIITIHHDTHVTTENAYQTIENSELYNLYVISSKNVTDRHFQMKKKSFNITPLGKNFKEICT